MICCFSLLLLLLSRNSNASDLDLMRQEIGLLKEENRNQTIEIALLKERIESQDEKMDEKINKGLDKRMKELLVDHQQSSPGKSRPKRPYRLIPARKTIKGNDDDKSDSNIINSQLRPIYGPSSSCSDLSLLGHTLNGFYLIKPSEDVHRNIENITKLETIFCAFSQKQVKATFYDSSKIETRMGQYLKLYSDESSSDSPIINFYVERPSPPSTETGSNSILLFTRIHLNLGNGFITESSFSGHYFAAPKSGLYHFVYRGQLFFVSKNEPLDHIIFICLNDDVIESTLIIANQQQIGRKSARVTIQATLKLDERDRIHLKWNKTNNGSNNNVHLGNYWFKGYLVREMK